MLQGSARRHTESPPEVRAIARRGMRFSCPAGAPWVFGECSGGCAWGHADPRLSSGVPQGRKMRAGTRFPRLSSGVPQGGGKFLCLPHPRGFGCWKSNDAEPFGFRGGGESGIGAGKGEAWQPGLLQGKRGGQLQGVRRAQRMGAQQPTGEAADHRHWRNFLPGAGELLQTLAGLPGLINAQPTLAQAALNG